MDKSLSVPTIHQISSLIRLAVSINTPVAMLPMWSCSCIRWTGWRVAPTTLVISVSLLFCWVFERELNLWLGFLTASDETSTISDDPSPVMTYLEDCYILKEGRVKEPDTYLGVDVWKIQIDWSDDPENMHWGMWHLCKTGCIWPWKQAQSHRSEVDDHSNNPNSRYWQTQAWCLTRARRDQSQLLSMVDWSPSYTVKGERWKVKGKR